MRRGLFFVATVLATLLPAVPVQAGTGASDACFDGTWTDVPLLPGPVTIGIEINTGSPGTWVTVCYATSEVGYEAAQLIGGYVKMFVAPNGSGFLQCESDDNADTVSLDCSAPFSITPTTGGLAITFQGTVDTSVTNPITVGATGLAVSPFLSIGPGVTVNPSYPCVYLLGSPVLPCGHPIIP